MSELSYFNKQVGSDFDVIFNGDVIDRLTLVRTGTLPPPPAGYAEVRQEPFELLFRSHSDKRIDATVTIRDTNGKDSLIYLNPECLYRCPDSGKSVIQYHCCYT